MPVTRVWRGKSGALFHDSCFEEGESRAGFEPVKFEELEDDDSCGSCEGALKMLRPVAEVEAENAEEPDEEYPKD